jgi:UDP-glucose-4-epimerase GalE
MREHGIEAVMHFAALAYVGQSVQHPSVYYDVNVNGTRTLLDAMIETGVAKLVFSSSCAIYGEPQAIPITESTNSSPINPYGYTKLVCERMIDDYAAAYGIRSAKLRYFNAAGADPDGELGEDHSPETHLIPLVLDAALLRRRAISVYGDDYGTPDGTAIRDYVHVTDLAAAHVLALDVLQSDRSSFAVNLGGGKGVSVAELISWAREITARDIAVQIEPRRVGDPAVLVADPAAAMRILGWRALRSSPAVILGDAWKWHKKRFDGC